MPSNLTWGAALFTINDEDGTSQDIVVTGRDRWALEALIAAGEDGCTPIDTPGPRWSGYVHNLRNLGVPIETITEAHSGPFNDTPPRYVLSAQVVRKLGDAA